MGIDGSQLVNTRTYRPGGYPFSCLWASRSFGMDMDDMFTQAMNAVSRGMQDTTCT